LDVDREVSGTATIGFSTPTLGAAAVRAMVHGLAWVAETRGATVAVGDARLDHALQLEQLDELVRLGVDALLVYPVGTPEELRPALDRASDAGVFLFSHDDVGHPAVVTQLLTPGDVMARLSMRILNDALGGKGNVVLVDGIPAPQIRERTDEFRRMFAKEYTGLLVAGEVINETDDAPGARDVIAELLRTQDIPDGIITYNDASAIGSADAVEAAGARVVIVGCNGEPECLEAIRAGRVAGTVERHPIELAQRGAEVILDVVAGVIACEDAPHSLAAEPEVITAANVDQFLPWPERAPEPDWSRTCHFL
jgi:ribose transport system substrate-binding protein